VDVFDSNKNNTLGYELIQNLGNGDDESSSSSSTTTKSETATGPVFPRVLAETVAEMEGVDVHWRSAGVDGGDTQHVRDYCLPVIAEEVQKGRVPQLVVLLVGVNDLKYFMSKPWLGGNPGPRIFQQRLHDLIDSIHELAPGCTIVLPAVPAQMFHKNSPMNIFPFSFIMDAVIGFWESLKIGVADRVVDGEDIMAPPPLRSGDGPKKGRVVFVRMDPEEVLQWYGEPSPLLDHVDDDDNNGVSTTVTADLLISSKNDEERLIASDGVHPNAKCYALWAQTLAKKLLSNRHRE
jgi:lysophospholipase L1-like esterase